ncbi:MAG TPA: hypothetical protein VNL14_20655 [Candidatus Acidoferrales bacterium]|nr:hypothetical protein [Candidatus Acidoferrales bacterium]
MPTDETRRLLKVFGIAITDFEDAVNSGAPREQLQKAEALARSRLEEVRELIERLSAAVK